MQQWINVLTVFFIYKLLSFISEFSAYMLYRTKNVLYIFIITYFFRSCNSYSDFIAQRSDQYSVAVVDLMLDYLCRTTCERSDARFKLLILPSYFDAPVAPDRAWFPYE